MKEAEGSHNRERQRVDFLGLFRRGRAKKPSGGFGVMFQGLKRQNRSFDWKDIGRE